MNLIWRTLLVFLFPRTDPAEPLDVVSKTFRVLPTDIDLYRHMNNGRYMSIADVARVELIRRRGIWKELKAKGWYPIVAGSTINYRKSLDLWQKYEIQTRLAGVDGSDIYVEQRFVVRGEIYARFFVRIRFLARSGGRAPIDELAALWGVEPDSFPPPAWLRNLTKESALPSTREPAPSEWD